MPLPTPIRLPFADRVEAGRALAAALQGHVRPGAIVLGLPRGGVPVAFEVAAALGLPLDVFIVRKLGVPGHEELAMGAIATGGVRVLNQEVLDGLPITSDAIERVVAREMEELRRREAAYRGDRGPVQVQGRAVILVDDGLATGATMRAAVRGVRAAGASHVTVAVPVAASETCDDLQSDAEEVICASAPEPFRAVGLWYRKFAPTSDDEVRRLLARSGTEPSRSAG
jgi:putative phosphoribosyl transferase